MSMGDQMRHMGRRMPSMTASLCLLYVDSSTFVRRVVVTTDGLHVGAEAESH